MRQRATKYCRWGTMLKYGQNSLSATPPIPLIPLPFISNGRRTHRFAPTTVLHMNPFTLKTTKPMSIWILGADALLETGTAVISAVLSLDEHLSQTNTACVQKCCYQSVYCCHIRNFLVRTRIAKCFTNSSKRFRCEVTFENEQTFCSWIHHVRTCTAVAKLVSSRLATRVTLSRVSQGRLG
jgi:hypothetical protein